MIIKEVDLHLKGDIHFLDMEYIDGGDLTDPMMRYSHLKFPEERVMEIAKQIAAGVQEIHKRQIIHKDLKPQNIMITKNETIKIMNFGIAETIRSSQSRLKETSQSYRYLCLNVS